MAGDPAVDALCRAGRFREAAELLESRGQLRRAAELYASAWDFRRASELAAQGGAPELAYRYALDAGDRTAVERLLASAIASTAEAERLLAVAEARGEHRDAARLAGALGRHADAAARYEHAGELVRAAASFEAARDWRAAIARYERALTADPRDPQATAGLALLLARHGRWESAVPLLQRVVDDPAYRPAAARALREGLLALGLRHAANVWRAEVSDDGPAPPRGRDTADEGRSVRPVGPPLPDRHGLLLGRYRVLGELGAGATGRVVLARDVLLDDEVAIKLLHDDGAPGAREAQLRFAREAEAAAALDDPRIVRVLSVHAEELMLVMEHVPGGTLADRLEGRGPPLGRAEARAVALGILGGLEVVHARGIIHRDLKPANVLLTPTGGVKLADFGAAHLVDRGATRTGAMLGSVATMAPEQITGAPSPDASTDLYAFGAILFALVTGRFPFEGPDIVTQHLTAPVPRASELLGPAGLPFDAVFTELLAKRQDERPRSAADVRARLEALPWDTLPSPAAPAGATADDGPVAEGGERYERLSADRDGRVVCRDLRRARLVRLEPCDAVRAAYLRAASRAASPFLQRVYDVADDDASAIVEWPTGTELRDGQPAAALRARVGAELEAALLTLASVGLAHGSVDGAHVRLGSSRAVLLLPEVPPPPADAEALEADRAALRALLTADR